MAWAMVAKFAALYGWEKRSDDAITAIVGYFLFAAGVIHLTSDGRSHATMWPADALILALLLKNPRRYWPLILLAGGLGNLMANTVTRGWAPGLILYGIINMAQTALAAWLIDRDQSGGDLLANPSAVLRFVAGAGVIAPLAGAVLGSAVTVVLYGQPFVTSVVSWYLSNALGLLVITPFLCAVFDGSYVRCFRQRTPQGRAEAVGLGALHLAVTCAVFSLNSLPLLFVPVSTVLVLSFRIGRLGTIMGVMMVALVGASATFMGHGPMGMGIAAQEYFFQFYLAVMLATTLPVAATVSARGEAVKLLAEREEALRLMMTHSPDGILSFDETGHCRWADGPLMAYLGVAPEEMIGRSLDVISLQARDMVADMRLRDADGDGRPVVLEFVPALRPHLTLEASIGTLRREGQRAGTVVTLRDVTRRKAKEAAMLTKVQQDDLTGLVNRSGFRRHLRAALADETRPTTLALVDIDRFKAINDSHGHGVGDAVLLEVARRLKAATRMDDVVARLGGDEFAILLRCDLDTAHAVCQRMVDSVRESPVHRDGVLSVLTSISCGLAQYGLGAGRDEVFDAADAALYEVKRAGRNGVRAVA